MPKRLQSPTNSQYKTSTGLKASFCQTLISVPQQQQTPIRWQTACLPLSGRYRLRLDLATLDFCFQRHFQRAFFNPGSLSLVFHTVARLGGICAGCATQCQRLNPLMCSAQDASGLTAGFLSTRCPLLSGATQRPQVERPQHRLGVSSA